MAGGSRVYSFGTHDDHPFGNGQSAVGRPIKSFLLRGKYQPRRATSLFHTSRENLLIAYLHFDT